MKLTEALRESDIGCVKWKNLVWKMIKTNCYGTGPDTIDFITGAGGWGEDYLSNYYEKGDDTFEPYTQAMKDEEK